MAKISDITIKVTLEISAEDRGYLDLLKELRQAQLNSTPVPLVVQPPFVLQKDLKAVISGTLYPTSSFLAEVEQAIPRWLKQWKAEHLDFKDATQFHPQRKPWPECVKPWPDEHGLQPRDASSGYVDTFSQGRIHIHTGDWIMTETKGKEWVEVVKREYLRANGLGGYEE